MRARTFFSRVGLVALGLILAALILEAILQLGAVVVRATGRTAPGHFISGNLRVLCVGDSNTYGLHLPRDDAYPQQLERRWAEAGSEPPLEVLNLGAPGTNSSRLLAELPRMLDTLLPDVVVLMVGVNDFWTMPVPVRGDREDVQVGWLASHSRLYEALRMLRRSFVAHEVEVDLDPELSKNIRGENTLRFGGTEFHLGFERADAEHAGDREDLEENLRRMVREVRQRDLTLVMMDYPSRFKILYPHASGSIRQVAAETGTPLVRLSDRFVPLCPEEECPRFLLPDHHPTAEGYRVIAQTLVKALPRVLATP